VHCKSAGDTLLVLFIQWKHCILFKNKKDFL